MQNTITVVFGISQGNTRAKMFYSDYVYAARRVFAYLALFRNHYDVCDNGKVIRSVSYNDVVWC